MMNLTASLLMFALLQTAVVPQSPAPATNPEIWVSAWKSVPDGLRFVSPMLWVDGDYRPSADNPSIDPEPIARASRALPPGRRVLLWYRYFRSFWGDPADQIDASGKKADTPWGEFAVPKAMAEWQRFLQLFKYCGGKVDYLVGDCEEWGRFTCWGVNAAQLSALHGDPRFDKPMYGSPSLRALTEGIPLDEVLQPQRSDSYLRWNLEISRFTGALMNHAIWAPAKEVFPSLQGSNYDGKRMVDRPAPDPNGHPQPSDNIFGTAPSPVAYGAVQQANTAWFIDPADPTRLAHEGTKRLGRGPWQSLLMDVQLGRACRRGSTDRPMHPWIAPRHYAGDTPGVVGYPEDPRCYREMLRHYALLGTSVFLWWNTTALPGPGGTSVPITDRDALAMEMDGTMAEINARTRGVVRSTIGSEPISFEATVVITGAVRADGRCIWRVSARPDVRALRNAATGEVVTLPGDEIGFWFERDDATVPSFVPESSPPAGDRSR
jgi:hypothetical protein